MIKSSEKIILGVLLKKLRGSDNPKRQIIAAPIIGLVVDGLFLRIEYAAKKKKQAANV
jgi:hypothetical protein